MTTPLNELAVALDTPPDRLRARLAYHKIGVRGKTLKQIVKAMRLVNLKIPEGVLELDGLPPMKSNGNGNAAAHQAAAAEVNLAVRLHGILERLKNVEPLARSMLRSGTNGPWEPYFLNLLHYAQTGEELDIQNLVRELKNQ